MMQSLLVFLSLLVSALGTVTTTTLVKFPNGTWIENLAVCPSSGGVLLTELNPSPVLLYYNAAISSNSVQTVYTFPSPATGVTGIASLGQNIFYVSSLEYSFTTFQPTAGTGRLWRVNITNYPQTPASVTLAANLSAVEFPNGSTGLPGTNYVLIADYAGGKVFAVNVVTGAVTVAINQPAVQVPSGAAGGVNGVHAPGNGYLYFTNSGTQSYGRIPINSTGGATGNPQILFQNTTVTPDDFAVINGGTGAYIADSSGNRIVYVTGTSNTYQVLANIGGPTSAAITSSGVYVSSTGGDSLYAQKPIPVGGALSKLVIS